LKLNLLLTQLKENPVSFNHLLRLNLHLNYQANYPQFKSSSSKRKWSNLQNNIFKFIRTNACNFKPKIIKKEIWFDYLEYLFNKAFDSFWLIENADAIILVGKRIADKMFNNLYFKFSSAFCNQMIKDTINKILLNKFNLYNQYFKFSTGTNNDKSQVMINQNLENLLHQHFKY
jgi:hypothetical protein